MTRWNRFFDTTPLIGLAMVIVLAAAPVRAATTTATFNVSATLTSKCEVTTAIADVAFTYTSFQVGAASSTGGTFSIRCTTNLPYTFAVAATTGTVVGLNYALTAPAGGTGAGLTVNNHTITGTMAAGQAGTCTVSPTCSATSSSHTLTVTY